MLILLLSLFFLTTPLDAFNHAYAHFTAPRSGPDLKRYPIPVPLSPYPVATPNSYRSDNSWGEIRTASTGPDQFRLEIDKEGVREGVVVYKTPNGKVQRQYYQAGPNGFKLVDKNVFVERAPKQLQPPPPPTDHETLPATSGDDYATILNALRPEAAQLLTQLLAGSTTDFTQATVSRPSTVAVAGTAGTAEALSTGTALAGPGALAVAAPMSVAIAGPGGQAFASASGISTADTDVPLTAREPMRQPKPSAAPPNFRRFSNFGHLLSRSAAVGPPSIGRLADRPSTRIVIAPPRATFQTIDSASRQAYTFQRHGPRSFVYYHF